MRRLFVIHFGPIELYPPVQNFLRAIEAINEFDRVHVVTTASNTSLPEFKVNVDAIRISRFGGSGAKSAAWQRLFTYFRFFTGCLALLLTVRPHKVLYYESLSSWPAYLYKRFFSRATQVFIHYHEYTTRNEFNTGMRLTRYFHKRERWLYPRAEWVSHTNPDRMNLFKDDILPTIISHPEVLPNYPPKSWHKAARKQATPLRIVYVGALSLNTMFTKEFGEWVHAHKSKMTWDIYSYNCTDEAAHFIQELHSPSISLRPGVSYESLPAILQQYDVGVVLYNGHIANYVYNQPNKIFEYLACGLDVWFSQTLVSSVPLANSESYPKILSLDFQNLAIVNPEKLCDRHGLPERTDYYFCETALQPLLQKLTDK